MPVRFDSDGDYLQRTGNGYAPSAFTVGGWIYQVNDRAANRVLHLNTNGSTAYIGLGLNAADALWVYSSTAAGGTTGSTLVAGRFYHVMLVKNGTSYTVYLDGVSDITWTNTVSFTSAGFLFGQPGYLFDGQLSHWRVWTAALSQAEVQAERMSASAVRTANLHAAYEFSASTTADSGPNSYTLTANGSPALEGVEPWITGGLVAASGANLAAIGTAAISAAVSATLAAARLAAAGGAARSIPRFADSFITLNAGHWDLGYTAGAGYRLPRVVEGVTVCELGVTDAATGLAYSDCDTHELGTPNSPTNTIFEARLRASHDFVTGGHGTQGWGLYNGSTTSYSFAWFWVGCDHNTPPERLGLRLHVYQDNVQLYDQALSGIDITAWHTYRVECRSTGVRFYVDGELVGETSEALSDSLRADVWVDNQYNNGSTHYYDLTETQYIQWSWINVYNLADWTGISADDPAAHMALAASLGAALAGMISAPAASGLVATLGGLTASLAGSAAATGQLSNLQDPAGLAAAGSSGITGQLAETLDAVSAAGTGSTEASGQLAGGLEAAGLDASGGAEVSGQLDADLAPVLLAAYAEVGNAVITAQLVATLSGPVAIISAQAGVTGQAAATLEIAAVLAAAMAAISAQGEATLAPMGLSAIAAAGSPETPPSTPAGRIYCIPARSKIYSIPARSRIYAVPAQAE